MINKEIKTSISFSKEALLSPFPEGSSIEPGEFGFYLYSPDKLNLWDYRDIVTNKARYLSLQLQAKIHEGAWHNLLKLKQIRNAETNEQVSTSIALDILIKPKNLLQKKTPIQQMLWDSLEHGKLQDNWQSLYNGNYNQIQANLIRFQAIAILKAELPRKIEVDLTAESLLKAFFRGEFTPPKLIKHKTFAFKSNARLPADNLRALRFIEQEFAQLSAIRSQL